jgi:hypothetical protein
MNTATRVTAYAASLAAAFALALGAGTLVGPVGGTATPSTAEPAAHDDDHASGGAGTTDPAATSALPGGLMVSQDGYTLDLAERQLRAGASVPLAFRILGPDGRPVTRYTRAHDRDLHLIAVRRDLTGFQHVHPRLDADGTWRVPLDLAPAGVYRVFADFTPADAEDGLVLGADLAVAGDHEPVPLPAVTRTAEVDGYTVTLDGTLEPGRASDLTLTVSRDGVPVTDLQPYLGAYGHLVALRDRDLAYLHVHPTGHPDDGTTPPGPGISFSAAVPTAGDYRLFLDFRHRGRVHTAAFTARAGARVPAPADPTGATPPTSTTPPTRTRGPAPTTVPTLTAPTPTAPTPTRPAARTPGSTAAEDGHGHGGEEER